MGLGILYSTHSWFVSRFIGHFSMISGLSCTPSLLPKEAFRIVINGTCWCQLCRSSEYNMLCTWFRCLMLINVGELVFAVISQEEEEEAQENQGRRWWCMMKMWLITHLWTVATVTVAVRHLLRGSTMTATNHDDQRHNLTNNDAWIWRFLKICRRR